MCGRATKLLERKSRWDEGRNGVGIDDEQDNDIEKETHKDTERREALAQVFLFP